jgi:hypothetical protein
MAKHDLPQGLERFMSTLVELRDMIDEFQARATADNWADASKMLLAIEALGRAGARLYNAQKVMAGGGPFSLRDVVRGMRKGQQL